MLDAILVDATSKNPSKAIQDAIDTAEATGIGTALIPQGDYVLDRAIRIPSYTRLILDGARLFISDKSNDENIITNSNAKMSYGFIPASLQEGITITGKNGAYIENKNPIFMRNVKNLIIENIEIKSTKSFGIFLILSSNIKIRNITFNDCVKGIGIGSSVRDCFFNNLNGYTNESTFDFDNSLYKDMGFYSNGFALMNHIIRDVNIKTNGVFAHFDGEGKICPTLEDKVGSIIFSNIKIEKPFDLPAFLIDSASNIVLQDVKTNGKLINDGLSPSQIYIGNSE